jgi:hypothetical protein
MVIIFLGTLVSIEFPLFHYIYLVLYMSLLKEEV